MQWAGCRHGRKCQNHHSRLSPKDGRCFNCGSTSHSSKDCTRQKGEEPTPQLKAKSKAQASSVSATASGGNGRVQATAGTASLVLGPACRCEPRAAPANQNKSKLKLIDSGASHRVALRDPTDTRPDNARLQLAVGEIDCLCADDEQGFPTVHVARDDEGNCPHITEELPMGFLVSQGVVVHWDVAGATFTTPAGTQFRAKIINKPPYLDKKNKSTQ